MHDSKNTVNLILNFCSTFGIWDQTGAGPDRSATCTGIIGITRVEIRHNQGESQHRQTLLIADQVHTTAGATATAAATKFGSNALTTECTQTTGSD